jgi:hypothetical protein
MTWREWYSDFEGWCYEVDQYKRETQEAVQKVRVREFGGDGIDMLDAEVPEEFEARLERQEGMFSQKTAPAPKRKHLLVAQALADKRESWRKGDNVLVLGEMGNRPGRVAVVGQDGRVSWGRRREEFKVEGA